MAHTDKSTPPEPGPLKLIIITSKCCLNCHINLQLLAKQIKLDDQIVGKKLMGIVIEGLIKQKNSKWKNKSEKENTDHKVHTRKDFSNQCTIIIKISDQRHINLKIFGNGNIIITGGLSIDDAKMAIDILKRKIKSLSDSYQIQSNMSINSLFKNWTSMLKYFNKNYLIFLKLFTIYDININLNLSLILNKKQIDRFKTLPLSLANIEQVLSYQSHHDIENLVKMIQIYNIFHLYFSPQYFLDKLNHSDPQIMTLINRLYRGEPVIFPITFELSNFDHESEIIIENYNTIFDSNFRNNRETLTKILNDKYKSVQMINSVKFEPSNYQGVNVKYVSRILCNPTCSSHGKKKTSKCLCKEISFLIFQEGNVIITGARHWEQIMDGYRFITQILRNEYQNIVLRETNEINTNDFRSNIIVKHSDGSQSVYLHKKSQILENPRNVYLLKQIGILEKYL